MIGQNERLWWDEDIGVADAASSLEAVAKQAAELGVVRCNKDAAKIIIQRSTCVGVQCVDGTIIQATTTIVATGPWAPDLLNTSDIRVPDGLFRITATSVAWIRLDCDDGVW
jgi:glycine/D-amino acid oxidase-like deaminating enzyme